jgi:CheY-like chemotaxis protein
MRVLIAEDDNGSARLVSVILKRMGLDTVTSADGQAALEASTHTSFDLILMDMNLPVIDGLTLARAIREGEKGSDRHVPIIALTGHAFPEDRVRCLAAGMDDYLTKPLTIDLLQERVRSWLGMD